MKAFGGRGRDRTGDPLFAKRNNEIYLVGSLGFVLCSSTRFWTSFGSHRNQDGPMGVGLLQEGRTETEFGYPLFRFPLYEQCRTPSALRRAIT
jgi:hypothetical protein